MFVIRDTSNMAPACLVFTLGSSSLPFAGFEGAHGPSELALQHGLRMEGGEGLSLESVRSRDMFQKT